MEHAQRSRLSPAVPLGLALLGAVLAAWSWRRWPDVQVDFGRELYAAWRLTEGDALYADLAWFNGPLSAWWNALWFRIAGVSLGTLVWVNLALLGVTVSLACSLVRRWSGTVGAAASGVTFLCIFAFGRQAAIGNYNFVTPYSHELTHGLLLCLGALACMQRLAITGRVNWARAAGVLVGLAFLTKVEIFVAAAGSVGLRLLLELATPGRERQRARITAGFLFGALLPPLIACALLTRALSPAAAVHAVMGGWSHLGQAELRALPFYRALAGIDAPAENLRLAGLWAGGYLAFVGAWLVIATRLDSKRGSTPSARAVAFTGGGALAAFALASVSWTDLARPYPLFLAVIGAWTLVSWWRARADPSRSTLLADRAAFLALAGLLLLKVLLHARLVHYGFVLGLPATLVLVALVTDRLPALLDARGRAGALVQAATLGGLAVIVGGHLRQAHAWYHGTPPGWSTLQRTTVGRDADRFHADWRAVEINAALDDLERRLAPEDRLLVLPEGVMLNYLLRRASPTRFVNFMPPELILWDEEQVIAALEASPPQVVALVHKDTREYGLDFGRDYGRRLMAWIGARYQQVALYGAQPLTDGRFGVAILVPRE